MTEKEFEVLDELYFVSSYSDLSGQVSLSGKELDETLLSLLGKNYIDQLAFNSRSGEYEKKDIPDLQNISAFHYLATKEGLLAHNS